MFLLYCAGAISNYTYILRLLCFSLLCLLITQPVTYTQFSKHLYGTNVTTQFTYNSVVYLQLYSLLILCPLCLAGLCAYLQSTIPIPSQSSMHVCMSTLSLLLYLVQYIYLLWLPSDLVFTTYMYMPIQYVVQPMVIC